MVIILLYLFKKKKKAVALQHIQGERQSLATKLPLFFHAPLMQAESNRESRSRTLPYTLECVLGVKVTDTWFKKLWPLQLDYRPSEERKSKLQKLYNQPLN